MIILTKLNRNNVDVDTLYFEIITNLVIKYRNFILNPYDYYFEYKKFKDYFIEYYYNNELYNITYLNYSGVYHREDGPARIGYHEFGGIYVKEYYLNGKYYSYEDYILEIEKLV